jgi:hypothetical protein
MSLQENEMSMLKRVTLVGPIGDDEVYAQDVFREFSKLDSEFNYLGALSHQNSQDILNEYSFYFTGTPLSVDKATIEAAMSGCLIVSETFEALELTGMTEVWELFGYAPPSLASQISELLSRRPEEIKELRVLIKKVSTEKNGLEKTIGKIAASLTR